MVILNDGSKGNIQIVEQTTSGTKRKREATKDILLTCDQCSEEFVGMNNWFKACKIHPGMIEHSPSRFDADTSVVGKLSLKPWAETLFNAGNIKKAKKTHASLFTWNCCGANRQEGGCARSYHKANGQEV